MMSLREEIITAKVKNLKNIYCICCRSNLLKKVANYDEMIVFKCLTCGLYIHVVKECCYYYVHAMPRDTRYNGNIIISNSRSFNCVVCGKPASLYYHNENPEHRANYCRICGAMMHISNQDCDRGFFYKYCPDCAKYLFGREK